MDVEREAIRTLLSEEKFRRLASEVARYKAGVLRELAYAETGVNDPRFPLLDFIPRCLRVERVKRQSNPTGVGFLVAWFRLWHFTVGIQVSPSRAMLWEVQSSYDDGMGDKSTLIQDPQKVLDLDPVFKNPLFWYTLALTRSGEKVCPFCLLAQCECDTR